ncbi:MAG: DUF6893 family small protein [Terracidiphilus sp.]
MKSTIWTVATLGLIALLVTMAPDIKRYMRIRSMYAHAASPRSICRLPV